MKIKSISNVMYVKIILIYIYLNIVAKNVSKLAAVKVF